MIGETLLAYERSEDRYGNTFFMVSTESGKVAEIPPPPNCPPSYNGEAYTESSLAYLGAHKGSAYFIYRSEASPSFFIMTLLRFDGGSQSWSVLDPDMAVSFSAFVGEDVSGADFDFRRIKTDQYDSSLQRTSSIFLRAGAPILPIGPIDYNLVTLVITMGEQYVYLGNDYLYCDGFVTSNSTLYAEDNLYDPLLDLHEAAKAAAGAIGADTEYWEQPSLISFSSDNTTLAYFNRDYLFTVDLSTLQVSVVQTQYSEGCTADKFLTKFLSQATYNSYIYDRTGSVLSFEFGFDSALHTSGACVGTTVEREVPAPGESWNDLIKVHEITNLDTGTVVPVALPEDARFFATGPAILDEIEPAEFWTGFKQTTETL